MQKNVCKVNDSLPKPAWVTIREAVKITNKLRDIKMSERDIYRHALYGNICLSIYFQSPPILRKIKLSLNKIKLRPAEKSLRYRLCMLDMDSFMNGNDLILSTEGRYIMPDQLVLNTGLREKGKSHQSAIRALAFKWIRIIYRCWKTRTQYDEAKYLLALEARKSPLLKA